MLDLREKTMKNKAQYIIVVGAFILVFAIDIPSVHALASVDFAIKEICKYMEGSLGGLLMTAAGVGGIASAAFGNMKAMYSCLVTAIGAYGTSAVLSLHFADAADKCKGAAGKAGDAGRVKSEQPLSKAEVSKFNPENAAKAYISLYKDDNQEENIAPKTESDVTDAAKAEDEDSDLQLF